jgi:hypothetical protein
VLFLFAAGAKNKADEQVGDPQLRGVCGEVADNKLLEERRRGIARGGMADRRRVCIDDILIRKQRKEFG